MKLNSSHIVYKEADVACSRPQLVLMLLDAAGRYTREAAEHLRAQRWAEKGYAVDAAVECLSELRYGLDREQGGDAAVTLDRMYDFLLTKLALGNAARDPEQFDQIAQSIQTLRQAWQQLFDRLRAEGKLKTEEAAMAL